jgi:hypothetical protein
MYVAWAVAVLKGERTPGSAAPTRGLGVAYSVAAVLGGTRSSCTTVLTRSCTEASSITKVGR